MLYSEGFNPRPKLSLPLPRSVGIEVDNDLLCIRTEISTGTKKNDLCTLVKNKLSEQLPDGIELLTAKMVKAKTSIQPISAEYLLQVHAEYLNEELKNRIQSLLVSENLTLRRRTSSENSKFKNLNVRPFLKSIELADDIITVECQISMVGSIRIDEILKILELDYGMLSAPIRRTRVQWQVSKS